MLPTIEMQNMAKTNNATTTYRPTMMYFRWSIFCFLVLLPRNRFGPIFNFPAPYKEIKDWPLPRWGRGWKNIKPTGSPLPPRSPWRSPRWGTVARSRRCPASTCARRNSVERDVQHTQPLLEEKR